jgi:hypothetical protein
MLSATYLYIYNVFIILIIIWYLSMTGSIIQTRTTSYITNTTSIQQYSFYVPYVLPLGAIFFSGIITETVCSNNPKFYYHLYSGLCFLISSKYVYI